MPLNKNANTKLFQSGTLPFSWIFSSKCNIVVFWGSVDWGNFTLDPSLIHEGNTKYRHFNHIEQLVSAWNIKLV